MLEVGFHAVVGNGVVRGGIVDDVMVRLLPKPQFAPVVLMNFREDAVCGLGKDVRVRRIGEVLPIREDSVRGSESQHAVVRFPHGIDHDPLDIEIIQRVECFLCHRLHGTEEQIAKE